MISHVANWTSKPDTTVLRGIIRYHNVDATPAQAPSVRAGWSFALCLN